MGEHREEDITEISALEEEEKENTDDFESSPEQERVAREVTVSFPNLFRAVVSASSAADLQAAATMDLTVPSNIDVVISINSDDSQVITEQLSQIRQIMA